jgi:hypothetical protein
MSKKAMQLALEALAEDALQQHTAAYQEMEQSEPTCERDELIARLRSRHYAAVLMS